MSDLKSVGFKCSTKLKEQIDAYCKDHNMGKNDFFVAAMKLMLQGDRTFVPQEREIDMSNGTGIRFL